MTKEKKTLGSAQALNLPSRHHNLLCQLWFNLTPALCPR